MGTLIDISITSVYKDKQGNLLPLPARLAKMTDDSQKGLYTLSDAVTAKGGQLILSDCFRNWDQQYQSYLDYVNHKKTAKSPYPGGSFHQAGRAIDLDLKALAMPLKDFWDLSSPLGWTPIIAKPNSSEDEAWHFEFRGPFQKIRDKYGYSQAAKCAVCDVACRVHDNDAINSIFQLQWQLLRLGYDLGASKPLDGQMGGKTKAALSDALKIHLGIDNINDIDVDSVLDSLRQINTTNDAVE